MRVEVIDSLEGVDAAEWNGLVGEDDPFIEHGFLLALEQSGCVGPGTGWLPCHLVARDGGRLAGAMPLYLKEHSFGEFVFDWGWAEAARAAGVPYYPKLVAAVPFTPVAGRRLLAPPGRRGVADRLLDAAQDLAGATGASSLHLLFLTEAEQRLAARRPGFHRRLGYQFHWVNEGYRSYEHYLSSLRSSARKALRRERRRAAAGLELVTLEGPQLDQRQWDALYRFYLDTNNRKWGPAYLDRRFFEIVRRRMAHRVVATLALRGGRPVAGALSFHKGRHLFGRYWGTTVQQDSLHFELCYHRPIELAIARGWTRFEAGAQGMHKLKRGLLPSPTHSVHWLRHAGLSAAVAAFLEREARAVRREIALLGMHGPFRRDGEPPLAGSAGGG